MVATQSWRKSASRVGVALLLMGISSCLALLENEKEIARFLQGDENAESRVKHGTKGIDFGFMCGSALFQEKADKFVAFHEKAQSKEYEQSVGTVVADPHELIKVGEAQMTKFEEQMLSVKSEIETFQKEIKTSTERITQIDVVLEKKRKSVSDMSIMHKFWDDAGDYFMPKDSVWDYDGGEKTYAACGQLDEKKTQALLERFAYSLRALEEPNNNRQFDDLWEKSCVSRALERMKKDLEKTDDKFEEGTDQMRILLEQARQAEKDGDKGIYSDEHTFWLISCGDFCSKFAQKVTARETTVRQTQSEKHRLEQETTEKTSIVEKKQEIITKILHSTESCQAMLIAIRTIAEQVDQLLKDNFNERESKRKKMEEIRKQTKKKKSLEKKEREQKEQIDRRKKACAEKNEFLKNISCELTKIRTSKAEKTTEIQIHYRNIETEEGKLRKIKTARDAYLAMKTNLKLTLLSWLQIEIKISQTVSSSVNTEIHASYLQSSLAAEGSFKELDQIFPGVFPKVYTEMRDQIEEKDKNWLSAHIEKTVIATSSSRFADVYESSKSDFQSVVTMFMAHCQNENPGKGFCRKFLPGWYDQARCGNEEKCEYPCQGDPCEATQDVGKYLLDGKFEDLEKVEKAELEQLEIVLKVHQKEMTTLEEQLQILWKKVETHTKEHDACKDQVKNLIRIYKEEVEVEQEKLATAAKELEKATIAHNSQIHAKFAKIQVANSEIASIMKNPRKVVRTVLTSTQTTEVKSDSYKMHTRSTSNTGSMK